MGLVVHFYDINIPKPSIANAAFKEHHILVWLTLHKIMEIFKQMTPIRINSKYISPLFRMHLVLRYTMKKIIMIDAMTMTKIANATIKSADKFPLTSESSGTITTY